ncbi:hypothetical protein PSTG_14145 [Puccinia striiformis f. sp. tritici PST-78]|uniref:Uncharacterized protein n=1 Tax=Puccinia striiformis f. sp. tritici PST-78 TaxID=1165861 RepID=A0A0L0V095_9BASI|nr:hypothetical protein PSTG_14145 [Puccinia striiformis f. sp. tritici PST-78]
MEHNESLQKEVSRLAFARNHPKLPANFLISHEKRIEAINSKSSQEAVTLLETLQTDQLAMPLDGDTFAQWTRFLEIHPSLVNAEEAFLYFYHVAGYFAQTLYLLGIQSNQSLQKEASQLAYVHHHPESCQRPETNHEKRVIKINCKSSQKTKKLVKKSITSTSFQSQIVAEGFDHAYLNSENLIEPTIDTIAKFEAGWRSSKQLAPYSSLIAPSLSGKTRLLKEMSRRVCVVYICLRPLHSTGYPPRTDFPSAMLLDPSCAELEIRYHRMLVSILHAVADYFSVQNDKQTAQEILNKWVDHSFPRKGHTVDPPFWTKVQKKMAEISDQSAADQSDPDMEAELSQAVRMVARSAAFMKQNNLKVILAIDEARQLLDGGKSTDMSFFHIFRRVIKRFPTASGFFSILADTTSRVSNVNPPERHDPSHRPGEENRVKLFPPIYQIPTFDINASPPPTTWQQLQSAFRLFRYGSPFWGVYVDDAKKKKQTANAIVSDLIQFALEKLLCTNDTSIHANSLTDSQAIALLGCTIQPRLYGAAPINSELVSSHLAQCMYIDSSRELLLSEHPSQFTLSSAANQYLAFGDDRLIRCIQVLAFTRLQGYVTVGDVSEIVSRIILLRAMQETMRKTQQTSDAGTNPETLTMPFGHSVRLADFLETLTGLDPKKLDLGSINEKNRQKLLENGWIFWNHFICIEYTPSSADLLREMYRGLAVQCKANQWGFDQIFSIYLQSEPKKNLDEDNITLCGIQVKNRKQTEKLEDESHQWTPSSTGIKLKSPNPYLVIYMSLRDSESPDKTLGQKSLLRKTLEPTLSCIPLNEKVMPDDQERRASLAFHGLRSFRCLSQDLITALEALLSTEPNFLRLHKNSTEHTKDCFKQAAPEVYSPEVYLPGVPSKRKRSKSLSSV